MAQDPPTPLTTVRVRSALSTVVDTPLSVTWQVCHVALAVGSVTAPAPGSRVPDSRAPPAITAAAVPPAISRRLTRLLLTGSPSSTHAILGSEVARTCPGGERATSSVRPARRPAPHTAGRARRPRTARAFPRRDPRAGPRA